MAKKQATRTKLVEPRDSGSDVSDASPAEEEFHTDPEDEDAGPEFHTDPEDADEGELVEYHTESEDAEDEDNAKSNPPLLPAELLKSKPSEAPATVQLPWDKLTRAEKKALRDERGTSMKELRAEAVKTGALQAGLAAQIKRGVRPADKVAGGRIAKTRKSKRNEKKRRQTKPDLSAKQQILEQRKSQSGRGSVKPRRTG